MEDGGPAFPNTEVVGPDGCGLWQGGPGMSLRDYFAAKALAALVESKFDQGADFPDVAERAYVYADAMLKERTKL